MIAHALGWLLAQIVLLTARVEQFYATIIDVADQKVRDADIRAAAAPTKKKPNDLLLDAFQKYCIRRSERSQLNSAAQWAVNFRTYMWLKHRREALFQRELDFDTLHGLQIVVVDWVLDNQMWLVYGHEWTIVDFSSGVVSDWKEETL